MGSVYLPAHPAARLSSIRIERRLIPVRGAGKTAEVGFTITGLREGVAGETSVPQEVDIVELVQSIPIRMNDPVDLNAICGQAAKDVADILCTLADSLRGGTYHTAPSVGATDST